MDCFEDDYSGKFLVEEPSTAYQAKPNVLLEKAFAFAVRIVNLHKWLRKTHPTIGALATQILKSGTSIGANTNEADSAFTKREFVSKLGISLKEARETPYWLRVLHATEYLEEPMYVSLNKDCDELVSLLVTIIKSARASISKEITSSSTERS